MSRPSNGSASQAVGSGRRGHQQASGSSYASPVPSQSVTYTQPHASSQDNRSLYTASQQHSQTAYDTGRTWEQLNPEVHRVVNDPRLDYTHTQQGAQIYGQPPGQSTSAHTSSQQSTYTSSADSYNRSSGPLTEQQLYAHNYGQPSVDRTEVWQGENQRDGCWYGSVEPRRS